MQKNKILKKRFVIDWSFILILLLAFFLEEIRFYFYYIISLILHEFCHCFAAKKLGYYSKSIRLNFFGAVLEGDDDFVLGDELKIIFAGPIFNFCVLICCYLSFWFEPETYIFLYDILVANWAILLFNLLPIFPLDFGRIILNLLTKKYHRLKALYISRNISFFFICMLFFIFLLSYFFEFNFSLGLTSINLMCLLFSNSEDTSYKRQLFIDRKFKLLKRGLFERTIYLNAEVKNYSLFKFIDDNHFTRFIFIDKKYNQVKELSEIDFYKEIGFDMGADN